jgi:septal ring factor EnvC (AmiA/AmiB activator)
VRASDLAVAALAGSVRDAEAALAAQRERIAGIAAEIGTLAEREARQRDALREQLRDAWLLSRRDPVQLVLQAEAPDRLGRILEYHRILTGARLEAIERWEASRTALAEQRARLAEEEAVLAAERDRLAARAAELETARAQRAEVLAKLDARIRAEEEEREELARTRARLVELLERLSREAERPTGEAFAGTRGALPWPVAPRIVQAFGAAAGPDRPSSDGVLIAADAGTPVRAVAPGEIVFADWMRGYGLMVIVDHGGGFMSLYARAESLLRRPGDAVEAGEPLATAGQSGGSGRSGVWFEIRRGGRPEDPVAWCRPRDGARGTG